MAPNRRCVTDSRAYRPDIAQKSKPCGYTTSIRCHRVPTVLAQLSFGASRQPSSRCALQRGPENPNLTSILIGARGTGKTAPLSAIAREAQANAWITARVSAAPGKLQDILERAAESGSIDLPGFKDYVQERANRR